MFLSFGINRLDWLCGKRVEWLPWIRNGIEGIIGREDDMEEKDTPIKVVVCGDGSSGKTSLCLRFAHDMFNNEYHQTLGLEFFSRRLILPEGTSVMVQVWDVGGQSIASSMIEKYVYGADAVLVVYDITNTASFDNVQEWVSTVKKLMKNADKIPTMALVGNKSDLESKRTVKVERHQTIAQENDMSHHYASARTGDSVVILFSVIGKPLVWDKRQLAAAVMKIPLGKPEMEKDIVPIAAEATTVIDHPKRRPQQGSTAVCLTM